MIEENVEVFMYEDDLFGRKYKSKERFEKSLNIAMSKLNSSCSENNMIVNA